MVIHSEEVGDTQVIEKAYMKQFDGATVKFVSSVDGNKLVIDIAKPSLSE